MDIYETRTNGETGMANANSTGGRRFFRLRGRQLHIFGRELLLPASRIARIAIGVFFIIGGCLAILPVFGIWMLPLGLLILSTDIAIVRRWRRRSEVRWTRWRSPKPVVDPVAQQQAARDIAPPLDR